MKMVNEATVSTREGFKSQAYDETCFWMLILSLGFLNPTLDLGKECYQEEKVHIYF